MRTDRMPEQNWKIPQSPSPVARTGAGDISERELSQERHALQTTPTNRVQPAHPKKQLFSVPVNKFTATTSPSPSPTLARLRSCLDEYSKTATPMKPAKIGPKAASMEDLTPTKRVRMERNNKDLTVVRSPGLHTIAETEAATIIARFMLVATWRRRRDEVRCLRKTLETQVVCSERLRIQVCALKSLLDSDSSKVRLAMRELDRLKRLIRDKDGEKAVLLREKTALENDVCAAEDKASEMSIGWHNCRNDLECARAALAACERASVVERAAASEARSQRDHAFCRLSEVEDELAHHEELLSNAEQEVEGLKREAEERQRRLQRAKEELKAETAARECCALQCLEMSTKVSAAAQETAALRSIVTKLQSEIARLDAALRVTTEQLHWWPKPLTRMLGAARSLLRYPVSFPDAVLWSLIPARHGC